MTKIRTRAVLALVPFALLGACQDRQSLQPTRANFTAAVDDYLAQRGHLCVAKYDWPIAVTRADQQAHTPDAEQMPALEALGLVTGRDLTVTRDGASAPTPARVYDLTDEGRKYYLHVPVVVVTPTQHVTHPADLCVARLSLDRLLGWEKPLTIAGRSVSSVLFSYRVTDPAPWLAREDARRAFPMAMRAMANAGTLQLRLGVHLTPHGWVADELSE
jgi:hypothetical protein